MRTDFRVETDLVMTPIVISGDYARQSASGHNVLYVLIFGSLGAVVGLTAVGFVSAQALSG